MKILGIEIHLRKEIILVIALFLAVLMGFTGYMISKSEKGIIIETTEGDKEGQENPAAGQPSPEAQAAAPETEKEKDDIKVYVVGCVKNPGIVTLQKGQLIDDAIRAAGGATEDADLENINMVHRLDENVMLCIYSKNETQNHTGNGAAGKGVKIVNDSGGAVIFGKEPGNTAARVNINTASAGELDALPGIGMATAKDIISFREKNGPFKTINDIMKVPGIKEGRFNTIKEFITVE